MDLKNNLPDCFPDEENHTEKEDLDDDGMTLAEVALWKSKSWLWGNHISFKNCNQESKLFSFE